MKPLPVCDACGRHELPPASARPPSLGLQDNLVEFLRFAQEFDEIDPDGPYSAVEFVDWLALSVGQPLRREPAGRPGRKRRRDSQLTLALAG